MPCQPDQMDHDMPSVLPIKHTHQPNHLTLARRSADRFIISHLYLPRLIRAPDSKDKLDNLRPRRAQIQHVLLCGTHKVRLRVHICTTTREQQEEEKYIMNSFN